MKTSRYYTRSDKNVLLVAYLLVFSILVIVLYPLLYVVSASFTANVTSLGSLSLWPKTPSLEGYRAVFNYSRIWSGYGNSILYMVLGTLINLIVTICAAYPLSRADLVGRNVISLMFIFTMYFSGGLIPLYLLIRNLRMLDTIWAMVIPNAMSVYNMIVMRTYFASQIPSELREAAEIDGCGNLRYLFRIVLPLSGPILAVIGMFYAISHWNSYFNALIYLNSANRYPLQLILREILVNNQFGDAIVIDPEESYLLEQRARLMRYSLIIISSVPMMLLYPFVQRYFVKGVMVGAVKG